MIKILHLGDIHLGYSYRSKNSMLRSLLEGSIENSFEKAMEFSINNEIDLLIIAGDLFDYGPIGPKTYDFFRSVISKLKSNGIQVIYALGNHDNLQVIQENIMKNFREEMIVFDTSEVKSVRLKSKDGEVYNVHGVGHEFEKVDENLIKKYPTSKADESFDIGVAHCYVESAISSSAYDKYLPTTYEDLISKAYNYFALGHIHLPSIDKDTNIAYSGSLQALSFKEEGPRGGNYIEIDKHGTVIKHMNFSSKIYKTLEVELSGEDMSHLDLINHIKSAVESNFGGYNFKNTLIRVKLKGHVGVSLINLLENESEYISEQLMLAIGCDYVLIKTEDIKLRYITENVNNQNHFLSYSLNKFDENTKAIEANLISNFNKNGIDINSIDMEKCVEEIKENMLQSLLKR